MLQILFAFVLFVNHVCSYEYETHYFKQRVDHFSYCQDSYFLQRYLISFKYWDNNNGPIFFYTGNEGDITAFANNTGFMWEQAELLSALVVFAEHRYYGQSLPYGKESFSTPEKRGYLTSEQALADYADLIHYLKHSLAVAKKSPVIAIGGSYGGMLSAWMRIKYPHLVNGAISSSAPLLLLTNMIPCERYAEIATRPFNYTQNGPQCVKSIRKSWDVIRSFGKTATGINWINQNFKLCKNITYLSQDLDQLVNWLQETWEFLAMLNYPYPTNFLMKLPAHPVQEACKFLNDSIVNDKQLLLNILKAASVFQNYTGEVKCFDLSDSSGASIDDKGWDYQSCTEMVMPLCQTGITDMFEPAQWNFGYFTQKCVERWQVRPELSKALITYGGNNISASSNIVFTNGKMDPWCAGGIVNSISSTLQAIVMKYAAHHLDLRASNPADPISVVKARNFEIFWMKKWIMDAQSI